MNTPDHAKSADSAGLWRNNPALVQLLGLCPLLAVSTSAVTALGLGLATLLVLLGSNLVISLLRHQLTAAIRLPAFVLIIGAFTTGVELAMQAQAYTLYQKLGIFVPLIVSNCIIVGRAHTFASQHGPLASVRDGLHMGLGFAAVLLTLGLIRELLGTGHLFADMTLLLPFADNWQLNIFDSAPLPLAQQPPGAFLLLGLLIALKNCIDHHQRKVLPELPGEATGSRRVRVTGQV
ncbi:MAG TPA: electron transport complex subunit RsxE [Hyphomicrobiales bacterium]|nr:electron transport complex subunit RsxE [Hyphomicrobiales bacterium]